MTKEEENAIGHDIMKDWNNLMEKTNTASSVFSQEGNLKLALAMDNIAERARLACIAYSMMALGGEKGKELQEGMKKQVKESYRQNTVPN